MKNLEANKIMAAILVAGLIALGIGKVADILYHSEENVTKRGFQIEGVVSQQQADLPKLEEKKPIDIPALLAMADPVKGEALFKKCISCHTNNAGAPHRVGPNLHGIVNAQIARHADFPYSSGMKKKEGKWEYKDLFAFLEKPRDYVPGTKMSFPGFKNPQDIAHIIQYLEKN